MVDALVSKKQITVADQLLTQGLTDQLYTHAVYVMAIQGKVAARGAFGGGSAETLFDLASLTKPMATATLLLQLVEQGALHLLQSVSRFFEEDYGPLPHLNDVEIHHLLTHTAGLPPIPKWPKIESKAARAEIIRTAIMTPPLRPPGAGYTYSDTGYILLGEIISQIARQPLDQLFQQSVAKQLGLTQTGYRPDAKKVTQIAPTAKDIRPGEVHDQRARDLGGICGHAGLFGTVDDVLTYAEAIRTGGQPILSRATVARMAESQISSKIGAQSYGWFCDGNDYLPKGDLFSDRAFGHSGFTGTVLLIDPTYDLSLVLLTNRVINQTEDGSRFLKLRRLWLNAMAASIR